MQLVLVKVVEGAFTGDQKRQIVEGITEVIAAVGAEGAHGTTWVLVDEVAGADWGVAGRALASEHVHANAAAATA